jgi:hypothetical protein
MKISKKWHKFLFGWRDGTISYLGALLITFGGLAQLLNGSDGYFDFAYSFFAAYYIFAGTQKMGFLDKWNQGEYKILKFIKNDQGLPRWGSILWRSKFSDCKRFH